MCIPYPAIYYTLCKRLAIFWCNVVIILFRIHKHLYTILALWVFNYVSLVKRLHNVVHTTHVCTTCSVEVFDTLHRVHRACTIDSFDFSTLFTKIPHSLFKISMAKLIRDAFSCRNAKYIIVDKKITKVQWNIIKLKRVATGCSWIYGGFNFLIDNMFIDIWHVHTFS